jgi:hypothetical protein
MRFFDAEDRLSRVNEMISTDLDAETILMSIDAGAYYGLAGSARSIWQVLETPTTFGQLIERLTREYDVTPTTCTADVQRFLEELERIGLLHVE